MNTFEIDDWNEIVPKKIYQQCGKELKAFVFNYFNKYIYGLKGIDDIKYKENLLFALVEFTSINIENLNGIGATYLYCDTPEDNARKLHDRYKKYLHDLKKNDGHFVTDFSNWYDSGTFIFQINNANHNFERSEQDQFWFAERGDTEKRNIEENKQTIPNKSLEEYLTTYVSEILPRLGLDKYPYVFITIKSVTQTDWNGSKRPIGNYFIHIGLKEPINKTQIINFIHLFHLTWIKVNWNTIFTKLNKDITEEQRFDSSRYALKLNIERDGRIIHRIKSAHGINDTIHSFFFRNPNFEEELKNTIYPKIVLALYKFKLGAKSRDFLDYVDKTQGAAILKKYENDTVRRFLISNLLIKTAVLIFDFNFLEIHSWYKSKNKGKMDEDRIEGDYSDYDKLKSYFQTGHFIYLGKFNLDKNKKVMEKNMIVSMSGFELEIVLSSENILLSEPDTADRNIYISRIKEIKKISESPN